MKRSRGSEAAGGRRTRTDSAASRARSYAAVASPRVANRPSSARLRLTLMRARHLHLTKSTLTVVTPPGLPSPTRHQSAETAPPEAPQPRQDPRASPRAAAPQPAPRDGLRLHVGARASSGAFSYAAHSFTFVAEQIELRVVALPQFSYRWQLTKWFEEARQVLRLPEPGAA